MVRLFAHDRFCNITLIKYKPYPYIDTDRIIMRVTVFLFVFQRPFECHLLAVGIVSILIPTAIALFSLRNIVRETYKHVPHYESVFL